MGFQVIAGFADLPVAAIPLPPFDLFDRRMHADPEHVEITQQDVQLVRPALFFDNVLDDQVVSGLRERGDGAVKTIEKPLAFARGGIVPDAAFNRPKSGIGQLVRRIEAERRVKRFAKRRGSVVLPLLDVPFRK